MQGTTKKSKEFAVAKESSGVCVFVQKLTKNTLRYTLCPGLARRFATKEEADKWITEKITGRFNVKLEIIKVNA